MRGDARCCGLAPAFSESAGQDGPLLYRGPCAAVRRGRQAAQRARPGMDSPFRAGRMPARKARPRLTDLPGRSPASAKRGAISLWLLSLWARKEKVARLPKADESSCSQMPVASRKSIARERAPTRARVVLCDGWSAILAFAGMTSERRACLRRPAQGARFNASTALSPPNANELLSTARTGISRARFGT